MKKIVLSAAFAVVALLNTSCSLFPDSGKAEQEYLEIKPPRNDVLRIENAVQTPVPFVLQAAVHKEVHDQKVPNQQISVAIKIEESEELIENDTPPVCVDETELGYLARVIYQEAGSDYIADLTRYRVGDVVMNRVHDERFPDTIEAVLLEKGQYGEFYWTGIVWGPKASEEPEAVQRAYDVAYNILSDNKHSDLYDKGYIWQSEFQQGYDIIQADGLYFGK